jgi:lysyl-tRNA synthetase class 2
MTFTEEFLKKLIFEIFGSYKIIYNEREINFNTPFKRIDFLKRLEEIFNQKIPVENDIDSINILKNFCKLKDISYEEKKISYTYLLDRLSKLIEFEMIQPTFLINHPINLSPLSKTFENVKKINLTF